MVRFVLVASLCLAVNGFLVPFSVAQSCPGGVCVPPGPSVNFYPPGGASRAGVEIIRGAEPMYSVPFAESTPPVMYCPCFASYYYAPAAPSYYAPAYAAPSYYAPAAPSYYAPAAPSYYRAPPSPRVYRHVERGRPR